jgi:molecular chaperone DnaJ
MSYPDAAIGAQLEVPNIDPEKDPIQIRVPSGAQPGQLIRVRDAGVPRLGRHGRGDLIAVVEVRVPKKLSRKAKKLLDELREELN